MFGSVFLFIRLRKKKLLSIRFIVSIWNYLNDLCRSVTQLLYLPLVHLLMCIMHTLCTLYCCKFCCATMSGPLAVYSTDTYAKERLEGLDLFKDSMHKIHTTPNKLTTHILNICLHMHLCRCIYTHTCIYIYIYTLIYIYIYILIHTYVPTHPRSIVSKKQLI